jgi:hypothetical protein
LLSAACGSETASPGSGAAGGGTGSPKLSITAPANGATVTSPFMLTFQTTEKLGKPDTGLDHVHVFSDGKSDQYTVVPDTKFEIKNLTPGEHKINVTLQHADHSPDGAAAEITVMVAGGPGGAAPNPAPTTSDDGY